MTYCPDCGTEVNESASFCESCGASLGEAADTEGEPKPQEEPEADEGFSPKLAVAAVVLGIVPAFGFYALASIALYNPMPVLFFLGIPVFGALLYRQGSVKGSASGMFFWLAVAAFLSPLAAIVYTMSYSAAETTNAAQQAGAAIGGGVITIIAFVVGLPVGIVLYLLSNRLDPEG